MDFMLNLFFQHSKSLSLQMDFLKTSWLRLRTIWRTSWTSWAGSLECWKSRFNMKSNFKSWFLDSVYFLVENLAFEDNLILKLRQPENLLPNFTDLYSKLLPKIWIMQKLRQSLILRKSKFSWFTPWVQTSIFKNLLVLNLNSDFYYLDLFGNLKILNWLQNWEVWDWAWVNWDSRKVAW